MIPATYEGFVVAIAVTAATLLFRKPLIHAFRSYESMTHADAQERYGLVLALQAAAFVLGGFVTLMMIASSNTAWAWFPLTAAYGAVACFVASHFIPKRFLT